MMAGIPPKEDCSSSEYFGQCSQALNNYLNRCAETQAEEDAHEFRVECWGEEQTARMEQRDD